MLPSQQFIDENLTMMEAMQLMDEINSKLLIVVDSFGKFQSLLSTGDIQRYLVKHQTLDDAVKLAIRTHVKFGHPEDSMTKWKEQMLESRIEFLLIVNDSKDIVDVIFWKDVIGPIAPRPESKIACPVVIMAGGKGSRLRPITNIIPKALIPIGEKTILELIIANFEEAGCENFFISINYKADMIRNYMASLEDLSYQISYFQEDKPLGTAGSLALIKDSIKETFILSNCDILIEHDYSAFYDFHKQNHYEITLISALQHQHIPYGILEVEKNGKLIAIKEKPSFTHQVNSGFYILEPSVLEHIQENSFLDMTDLILKVQENGGDVGVFPVSANSWSDIGDWKEYNTTLGKISVQPLPFKND